MAEENKKECECEKNGKKCCGKHKHDENHECQCQKEEEVVEEVEDIDEDLLEELDTVVLTLEDDSEIECGILGIFETEGTGKSYIALVDDENEIILYRYEELGEDEIDLQVIEDDQEYELVTKTFEELFVEDEEEDE